MRLERALIITHCLVRSIIRVPFFMLLLRTESKWIINNLAAWRVFWSYLSSITSTIKKLQILCYTWRDKLKCSFNFRYRHLWPSGAVQASRYSSSLKNPLNGRRDQIEASGTRTERDHRVERGQASLHREHVSRICFLLSFLLIADEL